jgi:uncharacterized membrane protein
LPEDEIALLRAAVEDLSTRVSRLEAQRSAPPLQPVVETARTALGLKAINRIGALTLAIGVIFFFKYTVDEQLIGAASGVFLGVVFGLALLASGEWLIRSDQRVFAQGVSGSGLAIIYISIYASFAFYKIVIESAGFLFLTFVSALAVALSIRYRNPAIAALGFIGALLTPILLHNPASDAALAFPFLLLVQLTAIYIAIRENWAILVPIVAPLAALAAAPIFEPKHPTWFVWFAVCLSVAHFAAFFYSRVPGRTRNALYVVGHCYLLLAALRLLDLSVMGKSAVRESVSVLLAVYATALLAYGMIRTSAVNRILGLVLMGLVIAKLYLMDVWVLARIYRITAFVGLGALLLLASYIYSRSDKRRPS